MKNKKFKIILIFALLILVLTLSVVFSLIYIGTNSIVSGISINNFDISGISKETANTALSKIIENRETNELKLEYISEKQKKYEKKLDLSILNIDYNLEKGLNNAYNIGRSENIFKNNFTILKTFIAKKNVLLDLSLDEKMLNTIISDISSNLPDKLVQSSYYLENDKLIITRGTAGYTVDSENFKLQIYNFFNDFSSKENTMQIPVIFAQPNEIDLESIHSEIYKEAKNAYFEKDPFKVYAEVKGVDFDIDNAKKIIENAPNNKEYKLDLKFKDPKIKLKNLDIDVFPDKLGTFSTRYDVSNVDRTTNLNLAADKIDGTILSPGEEFSYNKIVGERSIDAGYKEAKIYQGGQIIEGLGGGICQVSSTLYNAVVFANLKITERFNHQFKTSYVSPGRDATVAYGVKDFKFVNNRTYPVKINVSINSGIAKVDIYGIKEDNDYEVDISVETISNIPFDTKYEVDSSLSEGTEKIKQKGANGVIVNAYKLLKQNGITVSKELMSKDKYNALDKIIVKKHN